MKILYRLFCPNRTDALWLVIGLHAMALVACVTIPTVGALQVGSNVRIWYGLLGSVAAGTWIALAATVSWRLLQPSRTAALIMSSLITILFLAIWIWLQLEHVFTDGQAYLFAYQAEPKAPPGKSDILLKLGLDTLIVVVVAAVVWGINVLVQKASRWLGRRAKSNAERLKASRSKVLIYVAIALFVIAAANNIRHEYFPPSSRRGSGWSLGPWAAMFLPLVCLIYLLMVVWFSRCMVSSGIWLQKIASVAIVGFLSVFICAEVLDDRINSALAVILVVSWCLSLIAAGGKAGAQQRSPLYCWPSLWGAVLAIGVTGACAFPWLFDIDPLINSNKGGLDWEMARESRLMNVQSQGRMRLVSLWEAGGNPIWKVQLGPDAPVDALKVLQSKQMLNISNGLEVADLGPEIDTSYLEGVSVPMLVLTRPRATSEQMQDILDCTSNLILSDGFEWDSVEQSGQSELKITTSMISFSGPPGTIDHFLGGIEDPGTLNTLYTYTRINNFDWQEIRQIAENTSVNLYGGVAADVDFSEDRELDLTKVFFQLGDDAASRKKLRSIVTETNARLYLNQLASEPNAFFDLIVYRKGNAMYWNPGQVIERAIASDTTRSVEAVLDELGLIYAKNQQGEAVGLVAPDCEAMLKFSSMTSLKKISFDGSWFVEKPSGFGMATMGGPTHLAKYLMKLKQLEELWFGESFVPVDLQFLAVMNLKHLQIAAVDRTVTGKSGFDKCTTLETVTFFGWPDKRTIVELLRLPNLKQVTIVDDGSAVMTEDQLRKALGKIPLKVLQPQDMSQRVPREFQEFLKKRRQKLSADLSWLDEIFESK